MNFPQNPTVGEDAPIKRSFFRSRNFQLILLAVAAVALLASVLFYFKDWVVAAMVNGRPITRMAVVNELERQNGGRVLDALITQKLIKDEAKKQGVVVNDEEINGKLKELEDELALQGQSLDNVLGAQNISRGELYEQLEIQLLVEKILGSQIEVSDEEVSKYIEENKELFGEDVDTSTIEFKQGVEDQLRNQKLGQEFQKWLAELKDSADIKYFKQY